MTLEKTSADGFLEILNLKQSPPNSTQLQMCVCSAQVHPSMTQQVSKFPLQLKFYPLFQRNFTSISDHRTVLYTYLWWRMYIGFACAGEKKQLSEKNRI